MIANLLADRDGDGRIDRLGEKVTVRGRATVDANVLNGQYLMLYMQDSTAGIMVFSETLDVSVTKGDSLQVTGTLKLYASKPEIVVKDLEVLKSERRIPEAKPLNKVFKNPERFRGQLVSGEAVVQSKDPAKDIKLLQISPTSGSEDSLHVFVSRSHIHYKDFNFHTLATGDRVHIRGILIRYTSDFNGSVYYQVLPRRRDDLMINNLQPTVREGGFIYADIDTTTGIIYMLLEDGLWGYNLSSNSWRFLDALENFERSFSNYEFGFNARTHSIQLWSRGIGKLFSVDPKNYALERQDQAQEHQNQFGHLPFFRDSTLYAFGGYGYWNYHNIMVRFNHSRNEWSIQTVDSSSPYPRRRVPTTGIYDQQQDRLYIFGGRGTESGYPENRNSSARELRDIWSFSFDSQKWEKILTLESLENGSSYIMPTSKIDETNKQSSSLYLPDKQMWLIPTFQSKPQYDSFHFKAVHLPSESVRGTVSPDLDRSDNFIPTNYFYNPNEDEVLFVGIDNLVNTNTYPVRIHRMPTDSLLSKISKPPFYLSANLYYYLIGLVVIGGILFWFYRDQADTEKAEEPERETIAFQSLLQASSYNQQQKKLLEYMHEQDRFLESQEIEGLLWSNIESYDYRRRLRNDILKEINTKFKKHYPDMGNLILRKKDPSDNRRYLYGLNNQLIKE